MRLNVDISDDIHAVFVDSIPWGYKSQLIRALLEISIQAVRDRGIQIVPDIISNKCHITYKEEGTCK